MSDKSNTGGASGEDGVYQEANVGIVNKAGAGLGAGAGALLGAAVGGPVGAVVGATLGALGGHAASTITAEEEYGAGDVITPGYPDPKPTSHSDPVLEVPRKEERKDHQGVEGETRLP